MNKAVAADRRREDEADGFGRWLAADLRARYRPVLAEQVPDWILAMMSDSRDAPRLDLRACRVSRCEAA